MTDSDRPLILVSNDDGIASDGLWHLADAMRQIGDVIVCAPALEQSGVGAAMTMGAALDSEPAISRVDGVQAWQVRGTPNDAVRIAFERHVPRRPALVVSGVNPGMNLGRNSIHSGTIGAAIEGLHRRLPALAVSAGSDRDAAFAAAARVAARIAADLLGSGQALLLNVNVPDHPDVELAQTRITTIANTTIKRISEETGPDGLSRRTVEYLDESAAHGGTDVWATRQGQVSVTPLSSNLTAFDLLDTAARIVSA